MSDTLDLNTLTFLDPAVQECPFPAYAALHEQAPVFFDRKAGFYVVTAYDDIRRIVTDPATFSSGATVELARDSVDPERAETARRLFEEKGWLPTPTLSLQDDPRHKEVRAIFQKALRAGKIRELDPFIHQTAIDLVDGFIGDGHCDLVRQYTVPLPLIAICSQVGVPIDDIWAIKRWTDAWMRRFSMMLSPEEETECVEAEIEFQHYFEDIVAGLRDRPNDSVLSDLVNTQLSDGSRLGYDDIVSHLLSDLFVGGSETTTNAMSEGILLLCENPDQYALLREDLDRHLPGFVEETLRLQSPVQGLYRVTTREVDLRGVTIPARSLVNVRFAAANRDGQQFACPAEMDVTRQNAGAHLAFGSGLHHCIGAPLARREMFWGFKVLLERCRNIRLAPGRNDLTHMPGMMLRALKALHIEFDPA
ncbi:MAG: cytochrome P450 [Alphaproteobacteria bacterium]|nr:cytochrome P450 [Alphaproteobacteria bacterium]